MNEVQQVLTDYEFKTEAEAWERFDFLVKGCRAFTGREAYHEVPGEILQPRIGSAQQGVRIDRILSPSPELMAAGWRGGLIGVEAKKSETKIGRCISQSLDYSRSVFNLPLHRGPVPYEASGVLVMIRWVFVWPLAGEPKGDIGSVMAQNRIGWVRSSSATPLVFGCGGTHGITIHVDGTISVKPFMMGNKTGNRG